MTSQTSGWSRLTATRTASTTAAVLLTVVCTFAMLFTPAAPLGPPIVAVLLVLLWRRLAGRPWAGVGLTPRWSNLPLLLLGAGCAFAAILPANALAVALGAARWVPWEPDGLILLPVVVLAIVLGTALPEELLWRGNLHDILSDRLPLWAVLAVPSLAFGTIHLMSGSEAEGLVETVLFAVGAVALGFACGASRARTDDLWTAVGFHSGFYFASGFFPTEAVDFSVQLVAQIVMTTLVALLILGRRTRELGAAAAATTPDRGPQA